MSTPKPASKPKTPAKLRARKLPTAEAAAPAETPATAPIVAQPAVTDDPIRLRGEIARRAYALYQAGSRDTLGNWLRAEREVLGR